MIYANQHRRIKKGVLFQPPPTSNGVEGIQVTGLDATWRKGVANNFIIAVPTGFSCAYEIIEHESYIQEFLGNGSRNVVKSGSSSGSISHTFTALGLYDIKITATKGAQTFERYLVMDEAITCSFAPYTSGTAGVTTYDLAVAGSFSYHSFSGDNTGKKFFITNSGSTAGYFGVEGLYSTDPENPCTFWVDQSAGPITMTGTVSYVWRFNRGCRNVWLDGGRSTSGDPGLNLVFSGATNHAQTMYVEAGDSGTVASTISQNLWILNIKFVGLSNSSVHIKVDTPANASLNYNTWQSDGLGAFTGLHIGNCEFHNGADEIIYVGYVGDFAHGTPTAYISVPIIGARIYGLKTFDNGGDGLQMGAALMNTEICGCEVTNCGTRNDPSHKNQFQFSSGDGGDWGIFFYRNKGISGPNMMSGFTGAAGRNWYIFANELNNPTQDSNGHTNIFWRIDNNTLGGFNNLKTQFVHNTIVPIENKPLEVWNAATSGITTVIDLTFINNAMIDDGGTFPYTVNSVNTSTWTISNNHRSTNGATSGFKDWTNKDYRPADLSSALFGANTSFTMAHPLMGHDRNGYKKVNNVRGCYFGVEEIMKAA